MVAETEKTYFGSLKFGVKDKPPETLFKKLPGVLIIGEPGTGKTESPQDPALPVQGIFPEFLKNPRNVAGCIILGIEKRFVNISSGPEKSSSSRLIQVAFIPRYPAISVGDFPFARCTTVCSRTAYLCLICPLLSNLSIISSAFNSGTTKCLKTKNLAKNYTGSTGVWNR
jgi:hypothetical protein